MIEYEVSNVNNWKRPKILLKKAIIINIAGEIKKTINNRAELESVLIKQNKIHYSKVFQTKFYNDKIYKKLLNKETRDRILQGMITREECTESDIFEFLTLLKRKNRDQLEIKRYQPIVIDK